MTGIKSSYLLSVEHISRYQAQGLIRLELPESLKIQINNFRLEVIDYIEGISGIKSDIFSLEADLTKIAIKDRLLISRLYKISRRFFSSKAIACDPFLVNVAKKLMDTKVVSCCNFVNVRIDLPSEDKFLLSAHQDFPYIQGSLNGITCWIPIFDTDLTLGPPSFVKGSHKTGIMNVCEYDANQTGGSGGRSFKIADEGAMDKLDFVNEPVLFGEALLFSTLLVHRSEQNNSKKARVNIQIRFDDALSLDSYNKNYPEGLYLADSFQKSFPEYVVNE
ncbi:phytanoyl-CoA dioxygenase family protein [Alphaproteobacteria bacterium]|nr:phytanoyl-CoA dioxygenase family protein [Alphaproteobacteria bacterium]